ncbi:hypothetical protein F0562_016094 [Nyssa sinensis]|uniref:Uncharacterized protein n=1 Tax=Nyssa sinensis TaxID=561372 RepID=A0A5J4ZIV7_9ASTE|nr:hypothetical protein F0562_016094 [Nyssa sinensis]
MEKIEILAQVQHLLLAAKQRKVPAMSFHLHNRHQACLCIIKIANELALFWFFLLECILSNTLFLEQY